MTRTLACRSVITNRLGDNAKSCFLKIDSADKKLQSLKFYISTLREHE